MDKKINLFAGMDEKSLEKLLRYCLLLLKDKIEKVNTFKNVKAKWILGLIRRVRENEIKCKKKFSKDTDMENISN